MDWLPKAGYGVELKINLHKACYVSVKEYLEFHVCDEENFIDYFVSNDEMNKSLQNDELCILMWYPDSPVGSYTLIASSLDAIKDKVNKMKIEGKIL